MIVAKESLPLAGLLVVLSVASGILLHPLAALVPLSLLLFTLWFFRDPERAIPEDPDALVSPADGKVIKTGSGEVSIFMNVFDVHVCRAPMAGLVEQVEHRSGRFLAAFHDAATEQNERTSIVLVEGDRRLRFTLVAGLIARRIVCKVTVGQRLAAGQRVGLIRFGSRVDVRVPPGGRVVAELGQRVVAGETVIARLGQKGDGFIESREI